MTTVSLEAQPIGQLKTFKLQDAHYRRGNFQYHHAKEEGSLSSFPSGPQQPIPQRILMVDSKDLRYFEQERVLKTIHPGRDGRKKVSNTTQFPQSIHAQLEMRFSDGCYQGSGAMVGPHHLLTCAHNVYNYELQERVQTIDIYPGRDGARAPFGKATATRVYLFEDWTTGKKHCDIALLILNRSIGELTGWGGLYTCKDEDLEGTKIHITGYPGDKPSGEMWTMDDRIQNIWSETFGYQIDTAPGQSGSAIWVKNLGQPMIVGVHTLGSTHENMGVRISFEKFTKMIVKVITDTYELESAPSSSTSLPSTSYVAPVSTPATSSSSLPQIAFGKADWETYFGSVGEEPSLPSNINEILKSRCPFWGSEGKTVEKTHLLVMIPKTVNGQPFTIGTLGEMIKNPRKGHPTKYYNYESSAFKELEDKQTVQKSYWVLITKDVIPGSRRSKTYQEQCQVLRQASTLYETPKALEIGAAILMHHVKTGERLYPGKSKSENIQQTYTCCQEKVVDNTWHVAVGSFSSSGLFVLMERGIPSAGLGLGGIRKF